MEKNIIIKGALECFLNANQMEDMLDRDLPQFADVDEFIFS